MADTSNQVALEFVCSVIRETPSTNFYQLYDALHRKAQSKKFHNLGIAELDQIGISFSLHNTGKLEDLINEARQKLASS